ncbi:interferon-inducible GTPase 1-like [Ruditapes philippinarum]|uniref:interferon-inducible GTPase 1-like n=1 Tax=Ruditapes philippinarum TaxID=129788 RepID=UPI00295B3195|nr:interferon-inducible GTPase 1-like [Ruditapes philippinarum]
MWWIYVFVFLILMTVILRSIDWLFQTIPSKIETKNVTDLPVKLSKEAGAAKQGTLKKRKRVLESEHSARRKSAKSEPSELTDEESYRESMSETRRESIILSSDDFSLDSDIFKDEKVDVFKNIKHEKTYNDESNSSTEDLEFDKFCSFVDGKLLKEEMKTLGVLHGLNKYIEDSFDKWAQLELHVAVTGSSGVGKSSLINALRKSKPTNEGAAAVGVVETTKYGCKYTYPDNPNVAIWDLPGVGTQKFSRDTYLKDMNFARFNVVLIVSSGRVLENDIWLGKELRAFRTNIIFVRTKIDIDLRNANRDHPDTFTETDCLAEIRNYLSDRIRKGGIPASVSGVYLVSSPERTKYDFVDLDKNLRAMLSTKGKAIRSIIQNYVQIEISKNQQMNKNGFKSQKALSIMYGFVPTQMLTEKLREQSLSKIKTVCQQKFCIDEKSLDEPATQLKTSKMSIIEKVKSLRKNFTSDVKDKIKNKYNPSDVAISLPFVSVFSSAYHSYVTTKESINAMCDEMAADELRLAIVRLDRLESDLKPIQ